MKPNIYAVAAGLWLIPTWIVPQDQVALGIAAGATLVCIVQAYKDWQ